MKNLLFVIGVYFVGVAVGAFTMYTTVSELREQAIEQGYAEFDKTTGEWQWIEKGEEL